MFAIILLYFNIIIAKANDNYDWFAGNGLTTYAFDIKNGETEANCTTYDDCYSLLCEYTLIPTYYLIIIVPNPWSGNCSDLYRNDSRPLSSELDMYDGEKLVSAYFTNNASDTSTSLCLSGKKKNITQIQYTGFNCFF